MARFSKTSLGLLRRGFRQNALNLYGLNNINELKPYLSYLERQRAFKVLNKDFRPVLNDKFLFPRTIGSWSRFIAENLFIIKDGACYSGQDPFVFQDFGKSVENSGGRIVVKPARSKRARGVRFIRWVDGKIECDGDYFEPDTFLSLLETDTIFVGCRFVEQHKNAAAIFPDAPNTLRMVTFFDDATARAEILATVYRIGTKYSAPLETLIAGGITAQVDEETGTMSKAVGMASPETPQKYVWHDNHPDTNKTIAGARVPNWDYIRDTMTEFCQSFPFFEFIGWDIVVTDDGFRILEANDRPSQDVIQMHYPMLSNPRFRSFLERKGIVRRQEY